jgi:hypothetical protein
MSAIPRDSPLTAFHPFKKLPIELRLKIWGISTPSGHESRIIEVIQKHIDFENNDWSNFGHFYTDAICPALLHTCQESRNEARKVYHVLAIEDDNADSAATQRLQEACTEYVVEFPGHDPGRDLQRTPSTIRFSTYIGFDHDILYLNPLCIMGDPIPVGAYWRGFMLSYTAPVLRFLECLVQDDAARTRMAAVAIFGNAFSYHEESSLRGDLCSLLLEMEGLRSIHIVHHHGRCDRGGGAIGGLALQGQCRISRFGLRSEGGFDPWFSELYMIGKQLCRAAPVDRWAREQPVGIPKVVSMEIWRRIPGACTATKETI